MHDTSTDATLQLFDETWRDLFSSPVHLDSILSKIRDPEKKSLLATQLPKILRAPHGLAHYFKLSLRPGEPWDLTTEDLIHWPVARKLFEKLIQDDDSFRVGSGIKDFPKHWQESVSEKILASLTQSPPLTVRISRRLTLEQALPELPAGFSHCGSAPFGLTREDYARVLSHPIHEAGNLEIQDEGSQVMSLFALWPEIYASALQKEPGPLKKIPLPHPPKTPNSWVAIDACAGGGGKTLAMADAMNGFGRVYAYDVSERKLQSLKKRAARAGVNNIQTLLLPEDPAPARERLKKFLGKADRVLVDAPCSGWGVARRNPDMKWKQTPEELIKLSELQSNVLSLYSDLTQVGGILTYGVCTFRREETHAVVETFLKTHPEFKLQYEGYLGPHPCDGFYMASFRKESK